MFYPLFIISFPKPNTIYPTKTTYGFNMYVPYHVIVYPIVNIMVSITMNFFYPYLSANIPPIIGQNIFGIEIPELKIRVYSKSFIPIFS